MVKSSSLLIAIAGTPKEIIGRAVSARQQINGEGASKVFFSDGPEAMLSQ